MNILTLVFSLMLIFSFGFYASWDKHMTGRRLRGTYISHQEASRAIFNQFESKIYKDISGVNPTPNRTRHSQKKGGKEKKKSPPIPFNWECARLNLWPLMQEGKEAHALLYEWAAHLIRTFYAPFLPKEKRFEYHFLDVWIASAKQAHQKEESFSLEKVSLLDPDLQILYYKMLKGTKKWNLAQGEGYPPLLDYVKGVPFDEKICIFHAHPDMLTVIFNSKMAFKLHSAIHKKKESAPLTKELIERLSFESHLVGLDPALFTLLELSGYSSHQEKNKVFVANQGEVFLRKNLSLKK